MIGVVMGLSPDAGNVVTGVVGALAVALEAYLFATDRRGPLSPLVRKWLVGIVAILVVAGVVNVLGRTDGPLCDPDSLYQGHAVWHALTAAAFAVYAHVAFPNEASEER